MKSKEKLSLEDKKQYLHEFLDFDVDENGVIYDCEGDEFYSYNFNLQFDLDTLYGIMEYVKWQGHEAGKWEIKKQLKDLIVN